MELSRIVNKLTAPMARRIRLMVGRGIITLVNDALKLQGVQVGLLESESRDNVERFQQYGFTSYPHPGAEAITVTVAGSRDHCIVIAVDDRRYRLKPLAEGEVAIYDDQEQKVHIMRDRIKIESATLVEIDAPIAEFRGDIRADGDITDHYPTTGRSMAGMRQIYNSHTHNDPQGGAVAAPNEQM